MSLTCVLAVSDTGAMADDVGRAIRGRFPTMAVALADLGGLDLSEYAIALVDIDLAAAAGNPTAHAGLGRLSDMPRLFIAAADDRRAATMVRVMRATETVLRPFNPTQFVITLQELASDGRADAVAAVAEPDAATLADTIDAGDIALASAFAAIGGGLAPRISPFVEVSRLFVAGLETAAADIGALGAWLAAVRHHHSATFRHSLTVTGNAVMFGLHLGVPTRDLHRLAIAGLIHDIGKAVVPLSILDKPGALSADETELVRKHPQIGRQLLAASPEIPEEIVMVVAHHHEFLDGSGYPDGLAGDALPDIVRIITIADIFTALIEDRAYKLAMAKGPALEILSGMAADGKLDAHLVQAFRTMVEGRMSVEPAEFLAA